MALLEVEDLHVQLRSPAGKVFEAVAGVSFSVEKGATLGICGESGCGKSTLLKALVGLVRPSRGAVRVEGREISSLSPKERRLLAPSVQMVFQDPLGSLNPVKKVISIISQPLAIHTSLSRREILERARSIAHAVGIDDELLSRQPFELSGGQAQRVAIARALVLEPKVLLCDEPVSALDVSIQAQILNLLLDLQESLGFAMVFVSHDLAAVRSVADTVAVMYLGQFVELSPAERLYRSPSHPYTELLLSSVPELSHFPPFLSEPPKLADPPSFLDPPAGCPFHPRCPYAQSKCFASKPELAPHSPGTLVACHFRL